MSDDPVARLNAALEGRYAIERELGEGGMATVYLADDLKHERKVALKVLKPELAAVVGAERFLAEIKTTANLQHPHILPLHDSGEAQANRLDVPAGTRPPSSSMELPSGHSSAPGFFRSFIQRRSIHRRSIFFCDCSSDYW